LDEYTDEDTHEWHSESKEHNKDQDPNPSQFWVYLEVLTDVNGKPCLPTLARFTQIWMWLPHSGASVERKFSKFNLIKAPPRDLINPATVSSLMNTHWLV
jgi:hAT family C-terminal dimerisation region